MSQSGALYLPESNAAYEAWVKQHPAGYVINAAKNSSVAMYWHRVGCGHIQPDGIVQFVGGDFIKACALDPGELAAWAKQRTEALLYCKDCQLRWEKEHSAEAI
jgi:hypothetical protein